MSSSPIQLQQFVSVINYSKKVLDGVNDPVGDSIFEHSLRVFFNLYKSLSNQSFNDTQLQIVSDLLSASLLHDVIEDTDTHYEEIVKEFGKGVARCVKDLTTDFSNDPAASVAYLATIEPTHYLVKIADMLDNTRKTLFYISVNGVDWYENFFFPLINKYQAMNALQMSSYNGFLAGSYTYLCNEFNRAKKTLEFAVSTYKQTEIVTNN